MTLNLEELISAYVDELVIDLERMGKYAYAAYLVSPLRTTIAAHFVRLYQDRKLSFEQCLSFVDITAGLDMRVRIELALPDDHPVTRLIEKQITAIGFRREQYGDKSKLVL